MQDKLKNPLFVGFYLESDQNRFLNFYSAHSQTSKSQIIRDCVDGLIDQHEGIWNYSRSIVIKNPPTAACPCLPVYR